MRGAFVAQRHAAALACVPLSFALHQHVDPAVQRYDFSFLPRYDIRQIVDDTGQTDVRWAICSSSFSIAAPLA